MLASVILLSGDVIAASITKRIWHLAPTQGVLVSVRIAFMLPAKHRIFTTIGWQKNRSTAVPSLPLGGVVSHDWYSCLIAQITMIESLSNAQDTRTIRTVIGAVTSTQIIQHRVGESDSNHIMLVCTGRPHPAESKSRILHRPSLDSATSSLVYAFHTGWTGLKRRKKPMREWKMIFSQESTRQPTMLSRAD